MKSLNFILIIGTLALSSCGPTEIMMKSAKSPCIRAGGSGDPSKTLPSLQLCQNLSAGGESFPFVWTDGNLYYLSAPRTGAPGQAADSVGFVIRKDDQIVHKGGGEHLLFSSGIVEGGRLYVFGSTGVPAPLSQQRNSLYVTSSADLKNWTAPEPVITSDQNWPFFNSSVTKTPGGYAMALEVSDPITGYFEFKTFTSNSLTSGWTQAGPRYSASYSACPTIRYVDGYYYVWYLKLYAEATGMSYRTAVTRTQDFISWEDAPRLMFAPTAEQGTNMSDMDLIEYKGKIEMVIVDGDQMTWGEGMRAVYDGTLSQLVAELYKPL